MLDSIGLFGVFGKYGIERVKEVGARNHCNNYREGILMNKSDFIYQIDLFPKKTVAAPRHICRKISDNKTRCIAPRD
jgi:hypothetical protein